MTEIVINSWVGNVGEAKTTVFSAEEFFDPGEDLADWRSSPRFAHAWCYLEEDRRQLAATELRISTPNGWQVTKESFWNQGLNSLIQVEDCEGRDELILTLVHADETTEILRFSRAENAVFGPTMHALVSGEGRDLPLGERHGAPWMPWKKRPRFSKG